MARSGGLFGRAVERLEESTGLTLERADRLKLLEASDRERRALDKELDLLGWSVMDYMSGNPQDMEPNERRKLAQKARVVWTQDPQAGAACDLMNDFSLGRGVPKPKAHDEAVQEVLDEAWEDEDNQLVLTSYQAQVALGIDLSLQSNLFVLMFDDGEDGKVKLGLLDHDTVETVVRDPENRLRPLWYLSRERKIEWDYENHRPKTEVIPETKVRYYRHWRNESDENAPPTKHRGDGKVYHVSVNRTSEMIFGVPTMRRTLRWFSAYNSFLSSRVDMAEAAAAFIMKRKIKGTPNQVAKMAAKAISRRSDLGASIDDYEVQTPPRAGSILTENENVSHEAIALNSNSQAAAADAQTIRATIAASTRFPQHYYGGDPGSLAGATAVELPVLKAVEARQEVFEGIFRWFFDRVIERAVETGRLDRIVTDEETAATELGEGYEGSAADEEQTERDLGYEFSMPSPLRRMMTDLVNSVATTARIFDPNGTNIELSRILLTIVLGEALEVEDPGRAVERIFPEGYEDPALAQMRAQAEGAPEGTPEGFFGPEAEGTPADPDNPYSAPRAATPPEKVPIQQAQFQDLPEHMRDGVRTREKALEDLLDEEVRSVTSEELNKLTFNEGETNGRSTPDGKES